MAPVVGHAGVPASIQALIESSVGAALAVAARAPGKLGDELALVARQSFISGMDLALVIAAAVVGAAAVLVVIFLPDRGAEAPTGAAVSAAAEPSGASRVALKVAPVEGETAGDRAGQPDDGEDAVGPPVR